MEPYLRQWFVHESGGEVPVRLRRSSPESAIVHTFIARRPDGWTVNAHEGSIPIVVPTIKGLDPNVWCYLPPAAMQALYNCIKNRFDVQLFTEIHDIRVKGRLLKDIFYAFMEKHGMEDTETNWNTIAKIYKRKCDCFRMAQRKVKKD